MFRSCKEVKHIPNVAKENQWKFQIQNLLSTATETQSRLETLKNKRLENVQVMQRKCENMRTFFKNIRKKLNDHLDKLESDTMDEIQRLQTILSDNIHTDVDNCTDNFDRLKSLLDDIRNLGDECETLAFQCFKKCQMKIKDAEKMLESANRECFQLHFTPEPMIDHILDSFKTLGQFYVTPQLPASAPEHLYTVAFKQLFKVGTDVDKYMCLITGIDQLPDGRTIIVDGNNNKIKLLSTSTFSVLAELHQTLTPRDVCHTTGTELAVAACEWAYPDGKVLKSEIICVKADTKKLLPTKTIKLRHGCRSIAYHAKSLYVGCNHVIYIYNMDGKLLKKLSDKSLSNYVCKFSLGADANMLYVTSYTNNSLFTLDNKGQKLSALSDPDLRGPLGVCVTDTDAVFVCGRDSHTIIQVDQHGKRKVSSLATNTDGVYRPLALCYDKTKRRLLVGLRNENILVLNLI